MAKRNEQTWQWKGKKKNNFSVQKDAIVFPLFVNLVIKLFFKKFQLQKYYTTNQTCQFKTEPLFNHFMV